MADSYFQFGRNSAATEAKFHLGCWHDAPLSDEGAAYAHYLSYLLDSPLHLLSELTDSKEEMSSLAADKGAELDLLLYWEPKRPWWQRLLRSSPAFSVVDHAPTSVLVINQPHYPLRRILLILRANKTDGAAVEWLGRLARPARAEVIVLPIVPPIPTLYRYGSIPLQAEVLLSGNTFSGAQLRHLISLCEMWGLRGTLLLDNSEPQRRIKWAVTASDCDLVIISGEPYHWLYRRMFGEIVRPLLIRSTRPVLIANNGPVKHEYNGWLRPRN